MQHSKMDNSHQPKVIWDIHRLKQYKNPRNWLEKIDVKETFKEYRV